VFDKIFSRSKEDVAMTHELDRETRIIRTERGLTIAGTRITLYDVMDHLVAGWTPKLILNWLPLTEAQLNAALSYIDANRTEVEAEYQTVLQEAQQMREYWEEQNRERLTEIAHLPPKPGQEEIHAKLQAWKAKLGLTA
jgi:uncharacterized protein (DUF433 family)